MNEAPWFVLVGGINGSGKSTFAQGQATLTALTQSDERIEIINPDLVTRELQDRLELPLAEANVRAAVACEERVDEFIRRADRSFAIETVLSTDKYEARITRALRHGFQVLFVYMVLESADEAVARVALRVKKGGHDVPEKKVRERWKRSRERLPKYFELATRSLVFFNGSATAFPMRIAERAGDAVSFHASPPDSTRALLRTLRPRWLQG